MCCSKFYGEPLYIITYAIKYDYGEPLYIITYAIKYDYGEPLCIITYDKYNYERIIVFCQESGVQVECITCRQIVYSLL